MPDLTLLDCAAEVMQRCAAMRRRYSEQQTPEQPPGSPRLVPHVHQLTLGTTPLAQGTPAGGQRARGAMAGMPKLNMGAVKDKDKDRDDKEKKTLKESMRQLSRKASASLKRGLTPRGSRVDRQSSFDSLDEAAVRRRT